MLRKVTWKAFLAAAFALIGWGAALVFFSANPPPMVRDYKLMLSDGTIVMMKGTEIRGSSFCTDVILGGRVDTRICMPHAITEVTLVPVTAPTPEPERIPGSQKVAGGV